MYLTSTGIADTAYFGAEAEFFIFDNVRFDQSEHARLLLHRRRRRPLEFRPQGKQPRLPSALQGRIFPGSADRPLPGPAHRDDDDDAAAAGWSVECHHHEVATGGQTEIDLKFDSLLNSADHMMLYKYIVRNVANQYGKTVTFMPKPLFQDNGSGMHCSPVAVEGRQAAVRRRRLCRTVADGAVVHRRADQARPGAGGASSPRPPTPTSAWCRASKRR